MIFFLHKEVFPQIERTVTPKAQQQESSPILDMNLLTLLRRR